MKLPHFFKAIFGNTMSREEAMQLVDAYGEVLAKPELPYHHLWGRGRVPSATDILEADPFAFSGGRPITDLPAPKEKIRQALSMVIRKTPAGRLKDQFLNGYLLLAQFQDLDWCQENEADPSELRSAEEEFLAREIAALRK
jgi:hypothetical protein